MSKYSELRLIETIEEDLNKKDYCKAVIDVLNLKTKIKEKITIEEQLEMLNTIPE